ncbi:lytic transglycosylase domain-containing protein [Mangrovactinospora gilvigrisea]|uniref:lytic transglycosylase domain-containing protein n=1 Tax=Mangrovactinospora gilvigrisea TaxID=1428644 RepID=UPI000A7C96D7|nr:lytic murein transglycosylase [Mangrovactinospora gilvigrisea]
MRIPARHHGKHARTAAANLRRKALGLGAACVATAALAGSGAGSGIGLGATAHGGDKGPQPSGPALPFNPSLPPNAAGTPSATPSSGSNGTPATPTLGTGQIPSNVLAAYQQAAEAVDRTDPGCHMKWQLLAGIGKVESGHARDGKLDTNGTALSPIIGPALDGQHGFALIKATDGGRYTGDTTYSHAVGPFQFLPSTWAKWGVDGNHDGISDPENIFDAATSAADYLCAGSKDMATTAGMDDAILSYNNSSAYLKTVKAWYLYYLTGNYAVQPVTGGGTPGGGLGGPTGATTGGGTPTATGTPGGGSTSGNGGSTGGTPGGGSTGGGHSSGGSPRPRPTVTSTGGIKPTVKPTVSTSASPSPTCTSPSPSASPTGKPSPSADATAGTPSAGADPGASAGASSTPSGSPSPSPTCT